MEGEASAWGPSDWIAIYAAIVATGALLLELRRWIETGPRLRINLATDMAIMGGSEQEEEGGLILVTIDNRGEMPTMITHFGLQKFKTPLHRLLGKASKAFVIPHAQIEGHPQNVPSEIGSAKRWTGVIRPRPDIIPDLEEGRYYATMIFNHRRRPVHKRIPKKKPNPLGDRTLGEADA